MTREDILEHLDYIRSAGRLEYNDYSELHDMVSELEQTRWIPVTERLPEANEYIVDVARYYLVQNEYGDMLVARYRGEYWEQIYQLKPIDDDIVAWMPLPKLYEPQESEDKE